MARLVRRRGRGSRIAGIAAALVVVAALLPLVTAGAASAREPLPGRNSAAGGGWVAPHKAGELDCNGLSTNPKTGKPFQKSVKLDLACADPRGSWGGRFFENGHYIGHDEPTVRYISDRPGSGDNVTFVETLPKDPSSAPTVAHPGKDVTHWFELSVAPWFSTVVCDPNSAPLLPCKPESDSNAPHGRYPGAGGAFVELQFYPPGFAPFVDATSCNDTSWCSALNIDSLECTGNGSGPCNDSCIEPVNFGFIQRDGVPTGPPSPQLSDLSTYTPDSQTLMMRPGDKIRVRMWDAKVKGGHALEAKEWDLTTHQSGYMIASASNGFMTTSPFNCDGKPFNFQPEYSTARAANLLSWGIGPYMINSEFEIGHFEPCTSVTGSGTYTQGSFTDNYATGCVGPYDTRAENPNLEPDDAPCYASGDTHGGTTAPDEVTGCNVFFDAIGDLDYDGTPYYADWPDSLKAGTFPTPFLQLPPTTNGHQYPEVQFMTDASATEFNTSCNITSGKGCTLPPSGPGRFYPYWTFAKVGGVCVWEFGNMRNGNAFGRDKQYGKVGKGTVGAFAGPVMKSPTC